MADSVKTSNVLEISLKCPRSAIYSTVKCHLDSYDKVRSYNPLHNTNLLSPLFLVVLWPIIGTNGTNLLHRVRAGFGKLWKLKISFSRTWKVLEKRSFSNWLWKCSGFLFGRTLNTTLKWM